MDKIGLVSVTAFFAVVALAGTVQADPPGVTVKDGKLYKDGKVYQGIGVNYCDLFEELLGAPESARTLEGLRFLGKKQIPFVRFWACGFGPTSWKPYFADKEDYFRRLDKVVRTAEESGVGLVPSLFWCNGTVPALVSEHRDRLGDPDSKTWAFMRNYIREVVTRYKDSPAIWGWECGNEWNLDFDLPNGMEFLPKKNPAAGFPLDPDRRDLISGETGQKAFQLFAQEIRKHDPYRFVTTGSSSPRGSAFHFVHHPENPWGDDSAAEACVVFKEQNPDPMNVVSVHSYALIEGATPYAGEKAEAADQLRTLKRFSSELNKPLFVGEFAGTDYHHDIPMEKFRANQQKYLDAILKENVDLAAYWVFDYTPDRKGLGNVRKDNEYAWVLDGIVEYNAKIQGKLNNAK